LFFENRGHVRHWTAWALLGLLIVLFNRYTAWDQAISSVFFDQDTGVFPLKQNHLLNLLFHEGLRWLAATLWLGFLLGPWLFKKKQRCWGEVFFILVVSLLAALAVSVLKSLSAHSCPWDLSLYGGTADYFRLFQHTSVTTNTGPGKCFPSGHAATAFMWIVLLYSPIPWLKQHRKVTGLALFLLTSLAGGIQIAKGAHFPSHVLATAWLCWGITLLAVAVRNTLSRHWFAGYTPSFPPRRSASANKTNRRE
jgi:membrane-associated PAP2 superfamily phosphatase